MFVIMFANIWWRVMFEQLIVIHLVKIHFYELKVHYCFHKILPLNPIHNLTINFTKIQFNVTLPPTLVIPRRPLLLSPKFCTHSVFSTHSACLTNLWTLSPNILVTILQNVGEPLTQHHGITVLKTWILQNYFSHRGQQVKVLKNTTTPLAE